MRADARQNHDRLLAVAARHFAADGEGASMKAIAKEAGVGIGTLYRRFPTRETLVEATYRSESQQLASSVTWLLREHPPLYALRAWSGQFLDYMATKRGMAGALKTLLTADEELRLTTRSLLIDALATLLQATERDGATRPGVDATDVVMALGGYAMILGEEPQPGLRDRLLDLLLNGLRAR
jgi:AcrR family transcriptional regulator